MTVWRPKMTVQRLRVTVQGLRMTVQDSDGQGNANKSMISGNRGLNLAELDELNKIPALV